MSSGARLSLPVGELAVGLVLVAVLAAVAITGLLGDPLAASAIAVEQRLLEPLSGGAAFGTDQLGRSLAARVAAGLGWSLSVAAASAGVAALIGTTLGLLAADRPGRLRTVVLQVVATFQSFPGLVAAIAVVAVIGHGFLPLTLTLGLLSWPVFARVTYAEAQSLLARDYVLAARLAGASRYAVLGGHVLPGLRATLLVMLAFHFADMLIAESALSFLGLGAPLGAPSLGNMLAESRQYLFIAPHLMYVPAIAIVLAVVAANLVGDGLASHWRVGGRRR